MAYDPAFDRTVFWTPVDGPGLEHLRLRAADDGYIAAGVVLAVTDGTPFRLLYKIKTDRDWRTRKVVLESHTPAGETATILRSDGDGRWKTQFDADLPQLSGCLDVDISATPFTNTLVINRLQLQAGQRADVGMVYIKAPALDIAPTAQRYSCITRNDRGGLVSFDNRQGFTADLPIDADGLVRDYPQLFRRVYPI